MTTRAKAATASCLLLLSCSSDVREYPIRGQVVGIDVERREITLKHEAIDGYMAAMTMPFPVTDQAQVGARTLGELVSGTLVVSSRGAYLTNLERVGFAPVDEAAAAPPAAASGFELLEPGEPLPDAPFVDQAGEPFRLPSVRGRAVALTFIYTRCPLPTFCPMMDRHFAELQRAIAADPQLDDRVRLLSISFDPAYDTPPVLARHAETLGADPAVWKFLTGDRDEIDRFAARFGVTIARNENDPLDIAHNLRTAVVDPAGRLVKVYVGNEWQPSDVLADLTGVVEVSD